MSQEPDEDIDDTATKAAEIGKELGVDDKDEIPDYDVHEESDERIAKEREPKADKKDRPQLSNKEKRELRKKRVAQKFDEKDAIIRAQQESIERLQQRQAEIDNRLSGINKAEIDKIWNDNVAAFAKAEKDHSDAFSEGDGAKATKAMRIMYDAQKNIDQLKGIKAQLEKQPSQPQQRDNGPDPILVSKAKAWAERNVWYNPNGKDVDSEVAKAISGVLANEGYDPKSDDFWDELDDRLSERMPDKVAKDDKNDDYDDEDEPVKPVRKRAAPPVSGGATRGDVKGKVAISLPTAFIQTLKDNGIWEDVAKRNRIIDNYRKGVKENRTN